MEAKIKLTKTMLDKSIIDANKSVQEFLMEEFGVDYNHTFFGEINEITKKRNKLRIKGYYTDDTECIVTFYRTGTRGDKRISIQKLKKYADAGDEVCLSCDEHHAMSIIIQVHKPLEDAEDAA